MQIAACDSCVQHWAVLVKALYFCSVTLYRPKTPLGQEHIHAQLSPSPYNLQSALQLPYLLSPIIMLKYLLLEKHTFFEHLLCASSGAWRCTSSTALSLVIQQVI